jgi:hypothetical protein
MSERSLDGLKQLMLVKSRAVLPFLVPYLTQPPVDIQSLCALCSCASIDILGRHLNKVLITLVHALAASLNKSDEEKASAGEEGWVNDCQMLLVSVDDPEGVRSIVNDLLQQIAAASAQSDLSLRLAALDMLNWFCSKTEADYSPHYDDLVKSMLQLFTDKNEQVLARAWTCLNAVVDTLKNAETGPSAYIQRLPVIRQTLRLMTQFHANNQTVRYYSLTMCNANNSYCNTNMLYLLPGFCLPKRGITCLLPIFKESLLNGPPDIKEQSALTLSECIKLAE